MVQVETEDFHGRNSVKSLDYIFSVLSREYCQFENISNKTASKISWTLGEVTIAGMKKNQVEIIY